MNKYCNRCKCTLPIDMFTLRNKGGKMRSAYCKPCKNTITREWLRKKVLAERPDPVPQFKGIDRLGQYIARWYA